MPVAGLATHQVTRIHKVAVEFMIARSNLVIDDRRMPVVAGSSPHILKIHRTDGRVRISAMDGRILHLQIGRTDAGCDPESWIEGEGYSWFERVSLAVNRRSTCGHRRRLPAVMITGVPQRNPNAVGCQLRHLEPDLETGKALNQLVLIVSQADQKTGIGAKRNRGVDDRAEILLRVVKDALRRLRDERNPAHRPDLVDDHDVLAVTSFHDSPDDVLPGPQLVFESMLNLSGLPLIQLLANQGLHFIANRLAQLGLVEALNFDAFNGVTGIDVRLAARLGIAVLNQEYDLHGSGPADCEKPCRYDRIRLFRLNALH